MTHSLPLRGEIPAPLSRPRLAVAGKGFRPFFLLAAIFAAAIVPLWVLITAGMAAPSAYLDPMSWHAHEMIFGFAVAVIAGFLLTAVGNWTQRETLVGAPLLLLASLWVCGRLAMLFAGALPAALPALVDLAFLPLLIVVLARPLLATKNRRNLVMLVVLAALFSANLVMHLAGLELLSAEAARRAAWVGVDIVLLLILLISGRVFPMFTRNATGVASIRSIPVLDVLTAVAMAIVTLLDAFVADVRLAALAAGLAGVLAAARAVHWGARHALRDPLLWILHGGYAWVALGLVLRALTFELAMPIAPALHALTVGGIGALTLGMMARVSLGHTGRTLVAPRPMAWAFAAILAAACARAILPLVLPDWYFTSLFGAGALWTIAFVIFVATYWPILTRPRVDGKAG